MLCRDNPLNIFALHEVCAWADVSMATKCTVHVNLFGGEFQSHTLTYYKYVPRMCGSMTIRYQLDGPVKDFTPSFVLGLSSSPGNPKPDFNFRSMTRHRFEAGHKTSSRPSGASN